MKTKLLMRMLELTEKQARALREDDYELMELVSQQIEDVMEEIKEIDRDSNERNSTENKELISKIEELTQINIQIGNRKYIALKENLADIRKKQLGSSVYNHGYEYAYQATGTLFDRR